MARPRAPPPLPACLGPPSSAENGHAEAGPFGLAHTSTRLTPEHGDPEACVPRKDPESEGVAVGAAHTERERKGGGGEADTIYKKMGCLPHYKGRSRCPLLWLPRVKSLWGQESKILGHARPIQSTPALHPRPVPTLEGPAGGEAPGSTSAGPTRAGPGQPESLQPAAQPAPLPPLPGLERAGAVLAS